MSKKALNEGRHFLDANTVVQIGQPVEITAQERRALEANAGEMKSLARKGKSGWFLRYMKAHKRSHIILNNIMQRSHATPSFDGRLKIFPGA